MNRFALKIACLSAFAYIFPVITATYADSHIHHVVYGTRHYEMGYLVAIGFVLPFFFAYMFNRDNNKSFFSKISGSARRKSFLTFLSLYIPIIIVLLLNFGPQLAIISASFGYGLLIALTVYIHNYKLDLSYINSNKSSKHAKIERTKLEYETLARTAGVFLVTFITFTLLLYSSFPSIATQYSVNSSEQLLIFQYFVIELFVGVFFAIFPFIEFYKKMLFTKELLVNMIEMDNDDE